MLLHLVHETASLLLHAFSTASRYIPHEEATGAVIQVPLVECYGSHDVL